MHDKLVDARPGTPLRLRYLPGVDGLRALAVVSVLLYHGRDAGFLGLRGGFLGVEVFFVISGYLITALLLAERESTGRNRMSSFYLRRARRLLPPLFLLIAGVAFVAVVFLPDEVASLRGDLVASLTYSTNWFFVAVQKSYFEFTARPSLVQHLWSLAIEEQFYLVWPLIFVACMRRLGRRGLLAVTLAMAVGSTVLMALLFHPGEDPSRVYYGTDTRAAALLLGAALAIVWSPWRLHRRTGRGAPLLLDLTGLVALAALCSLLFNTDEFSTVLYRGGFVEVSLATVVLIAVAAHPAAHLGAWLGCRPLRWIGLRSYGIYLYHWPVFQLTRPYQDVALSGAPLFAVRVGITVCLAALSYRFVELPVRRGALGRHLAALRRDAPGRARLAARTLAATAVIVVVAAGLVAAVGRAQSPADALVASGGPAPSGGSPVAGDVTQATIVDPMVAFGGSLPGARDAAGPPAPTTTVPRPDPGYVASRGPLMALFGGPTTTAPPAPEPAPEVPPPADPAPAAGATAPRAVGRVSAIGDSVMLGASSVLQVGLGPPTFVDARVGRQVSEGIDILQSWHDLGLMGDVVVVHLGNNGTFSPEQFDRMAQILAEVPRVVFLTVKVPRPWEESVNRTITEGVARMPNAVLVDWHAEAAPHPEWFWSDAMHLRPEGAAAYNQLIAARL